MHDCPAQSSRFSSFVVLFAILLLVGCGESLHKQQSQVFGTMAEIVISGGTDDNAQAASNEVLREFDRLHQMMNAGKPSELSSLNEAFSKGQSANIGAELTSILGDATRLSTQSSGSFNPATGKLVETWGFHADVLKPVTPSADAISALVSKNPRMTDIVIKGSNASSANASVQLDLDEYVKGYALDRAIQLLRARGIKNALINIGGNMIAMGEKDTGPWKVGIQHPRQPGPIATLELYDGDSISSLGDYQRYYESEGKRYCHIIDPATGYPVQGVQAVTVVTKRGEHAGVLSNVASKPIFIAGPKGWREAAQRMGVEMALIVDDKGKVYITDSLARRIEFRLPKPETIEISR
ncbi:MAG TPA: FAD:protein FMN transferase [Burkholderiales bacterium]|nr:FAD:protein FMN transferase [Burkholderiales bacterium]